MLSTSEISELIDVDSAYDHDGILYLPENWLNIQMNIINDELTKSKIESKINFTIAKQLSRFWFNRYRFTDCSCSSIWSQNFYENPNPFEKINRLFNYQFQNLNSTLDYNVECFVRKGIIGWLSYMSFQLLQTNLFDLVSMNFIFVI